MGFKDFVKSKIAQAKDDFKEEIKYRQDLNKAKKKAYKEEYRKASIKQAKSKAREKAKKPLFSGLTMSGGSSGPQPGDGLRSMVIGNELGTRKSKKKNNDYGFL